MNKHANRFLRFLAAIAAAVLAIGATNASACSLMIEFTDWKLVEINGRMLEKANAGKGSEATLKLDPAKKRIRGRCFVNQYGGSYELKGSSLKFDEINRTQMAALDPKLNAVEGEFMAMLNVVTGWRIAKERLELLQGDKVVARFEER